MRKVRLQGYQKQLDDREIGQHNGCLDDEFHLLGLYDVPIAGHAHDDLHYEQGGEDQFGCDVENEHDVILAVVQLHESLGSSNNHQKKTDQVYYHDDDLDEKD